MQPLPYVPTITNYTKLWWLPNVVVAHQKEGIEALHLASGRTICKVCIYDLYLLDFHVCVMSFLHFILNNRRLLVAARESFMLFLFSGIFHDSFSA